MNEQRNRRRADVTPGLTSAGVRYQISHWLGWVAAIAQAIATIVSSV